jgi:predicted nucleic acid-binding protein
MNIYIVDSNVVFSAILNPESKIGRFIMASPRNGVKFYAPDYLRIEIERYIPRLIEISGVEEKVIRRIITLVFSQISFISDAQIPFEYYKNAVPFVRDVDMDDLVFVALTDFLDEKLWTGDMRLYRELISKGYTRAVTFQEILSEIGK